MQRALKGGEKDISVSTVCLGFTRYVERAVGTGSQPSLQGGQQHAQQPGV